MMRMFRGFYNWTGSDDTETLRQRVAELEAQLAEANQAVAYWKQRYENEASCRKSTERALDYTEAAHAADREEWWELVEGWAQ